MKTSNFLSLNLLDLAKGLLMAVLTPVVVVVQQSLELGVLTFDWKTILLSAVGGGLAYLVKNFLTPTAKTVVATEEENALIGTRPPKKDPNG